MINVYFVSKDIIDVVYGYIKGKVYKSLRWSVLIVKKVIFLKFYIFFLFFI